jgi:hypothetical protein
LTDTPYHKLDPFDDLASLRLSQTFTDGVAVKKLLTTVPVRKPNRQDFVRVHSGEAYRLAPAAILELKDDREVYFVTPAMAVELAGEVVAATIYTAINRQGVVHLWPVRLPTPDGKHNPWHRSAAEAAERAMGSWIRVVADMALGAYQIYQAPAHIPDPEWPEHSLADLLKIAFRDRVVDRPRDGRNRCLLSAFRARSGRNQPSNSKFIFGPSVWLRGLIKPPPGYGVAYIDWSQQEFGIAAALSGDPLMLDAYTSGDPYLSFAKQAGAVPAGATRHTHAAKREQFKQCVLAVQYGMGADALAARIGKPPILGRELIRLHQETYRVFWRWSDAAESRAMLLNSIHTTFGWRAHTGPGVNPRFLRNFPMQANGAEMLRLACIHGTERGIEICAPVHDAVLIAAPLYRLEDDVTAMRAAMADASKVVLDGFELGSDAKIVRNPDRYADARGTEMWARVMRLIGEGEQAGPEQSVPCREHRVAPVGHCLSY